MKLKIDSFGSIVDEYGEQVFVKGFALQLGQHKKAQDTTEKIVKRFNAHDDLVAALEYAEGAMLDSLSISENPSRKSIFTAVEKVRAALEKVSS